MEILSFMLVGILIAVTGFGALLLLALCALAFSALPAAVGWAAGAITRRLLKA
jgi:hypothetical protein